MKVGVFFDSLFAALDNSEIKSIGEGIERLVNLGIAYVEVSGKSIGKKYSVDEIKKYIHKSGVSVGSVYFVEELWTSDKKSLSDLREKTKVKLDECSKICSKYFMPVPCVLEEYDSTLKKEEWLKYISEYFCYTGELSKDFGVQTVIENFSDTNSPFSSVSEIEYILNNAQNVKYVLDTGNFWFGGNNVLIAYDMLLKYMVHIHLKEIKPNPNGRLDICGKCADFPEIGKGVIPHDKLIKKILSTGYNNKLTIEIDDYKDWYKNIESSIDFLKNNGVKF